MSKMIKAAITICRSYGSGEDEIRISIEDNDSLVQFIEIRMTPEQFGNAITGLSHIKVDAEVRGLHLVGKKRERREEFVVVDLPTYSKEDMEPIILEAATPLETDGWKASAYLALNTQGGRSLVQGTKNTYRCKIDLVRWVDKEDGEQCD